MVTLKKFNLKGDAVGEVSVETSFLSEDVNHQMIKDYIVALRANRRQWSANTKGRTEINHSNKKPWKQKGTGNARQGTLAAPQFKGGGVVFGPKPKFDQHVRVNRKERRLALRQILSDKLRAESVLVVEDRVFTGALEAPKTKTIVSFLKSKNRYGKRLLFVAPSLEEGDLYENFRKSMRNVPRAAFVFATNLNGYDLLAAHVIVVSESALAEITHWLK